MIKARQGPNDREKAALGLDSGAGGFLNCLAGKGTYQNDQPDGRSGWRWEDEVPGLLEVHNLTKKFGPLTAVDDVSFTVAQGEVVGFLGPNGAGKSTTMRMIAGYLAPTAGRVQVCGHDVVERPIEIKTCIGYLPEGAPLYGDMTAKALLNFVAEIRGFRGAERRRRIDDVVAKVNLEEALYQPIETLSKGFKRRVGLAQAILHDPELLVLDEPTDGLDPNQKHEVRELLRSMAADKAIIISTHILEEVDAVCTRAMIIARGRLLIDGTPEELRARAEGAQSLDDVFRAITTGAVVDEGRVEKSA